ncbi:MULTISPECIES: MBL fold metallo-hydrolase [Pseudomonadaceae]|jgi:hydroxyacylglutathione hydrolase|uniref:MBL fold metallo-hydrolase n=1 Tax=Stutzerimonas marianensis TaxID=2929513 RepID=A0A9X2ARF7_9GAMM|nr:MULTISPECIES: MBL fold metallo-hydrolase [Pseudomonadaceae]MBK58357.1 MBL fold metallo-hydrolase [Pseudomonas sp.]BAP81501.1 Zn-dependent hydrolase [Pseudomonas sp. MT-1]MCJ0972874.1 MBL fold metallo-hydrolase [Pseudomonas marianensis]MCQ4284369.1 rhodanese-like domain-containing protein [Stutzerimonas stutzeri]MCW8162480.1 MBL fold metallo-hydrolase [Stutzerimonas stutzeri]|tara:strand:+ start:1376 stop:2764 length:1389 start_codon:yes stop_codon:yes gene_type:complete
MLVFEPFYTDGLAQISYLIGDSKAAVAAVIDPRRDIDIYLQMAKARGLRIAYAIETHIHADFVSGAQALAKRTGAQIIGGRADNYEFELRQVSGGETIELGQATLQVMHTPGHTPEHISLQLFDAQQGDQPIALFTGDTLFNLDVGRPDLLGEGSERKLAGALYHTLFDHYLPLGDRIEIYPCHGAGSACGKSIGDRRHSTLGSERLFNPALREQRSEDEFIDWLLADMPEPPRHYARLKQLNVRSAVQMEGASLPPPLAPSEFETLAARGMQVVDVRSILAFGGGHVPGAINIALRNEFVNWAGWMLDDARPILLVGESADDVHQAVTQLYRIGLDDIRGYLRNGMTDWQNAALPLNRLQEWTVHELNARREAPDVQVLDVRSPQEVAAGRVPGARHIFVAHLADRLNELDPDKTTVTYCGSGYRASIAASILKKAGFRDVANVPGSWMAWKAANLPVQEG